ncbi:MAG: hypothetical protein S4CHLAM20_12700 [Chlamydiia bacterium]|nr:hypothetical protein [Chlamydiia bacterium]
MQFKPFLFKYSNNNNNSKFVHIDPRAFKKNIPINNLNHVSATKYSPVKYIKVKKS